MKAREKYIDIIKGISIVCIVLLHYEEGIFPKELNIWIGSFMITSFYFTSGWLIGMSNKSQTVRAHIKKRSHSLVVPYVWFSIIILVFDIIFVLIGEFDIKIFYRDVYKFFTLRGIGTLWFIPALLGGEIIFIYFKNKKLIFKLLIILITIVYLSGYNYWQEIYAYKNEFFRIIDAPFCMLYNIARAWPVIMLAYYIYVHANSIILKLSRLQIAIVSILFMTISYFTANYLYVFNIDINDVIWLFVAPVIGPFGLLLFVKLTENFIINKFFNFWGKNSLILMLTHYSIVMEICIVINKFWFNEDTLFGINGLIFFAITIIIEYPIVYFINNKAKFLLGKSS